MTWTDRPDQLRAPVLVAEAELCGTPAVSVLATRYRALDPGDPALLASATMALVLIRVAGRPAGTVLVEAPGGRIDPARCAEAASRSLGVGPIPADRPLPARPPGTEPITVVVATRERPRLLADCLDSLAALDYPDFEVVVVDNDPVTSQTRDLVEVRADPRLRYVAERRRGLAAAHNRGLAEARCGIVAFTDDDVLADRDWLRQLAAAMRSDPAVACVTGLILPAELITRAQLMLELHGHFGKGFERRIFDRGDHRPDDPLFPFTVGKLGSGANMAFDTSRLRELGGFDPATGTGTAARGGDDLAALFSILAAGHSLVYEPGALVWHRHRRDPGSLASQAYGYGAGLGAYLTSALIRHPEMIGHALAHAPAALAYAARSSSRPASGPGLSWPASLVWRQRRGLIAGPFGYARSRWHGRNGGA